MNMERCGEDDEVSVWGIYYVLGVVFWVVI